MANYVFNDNSYTQDGLIQECEDICKLGAGGISGDTDKMRTFTRRLNQAKDRFYTIAEKNDTLWNWDDRRHGDFPIATTNLSNGTADYLFDENLLSVVQVFCKDPSENYFELTPQDDRNTPSAYLTQASGVPSKYEVVGNSIITDKVCNYTLPVDGQGKNYGLKVIYRRKAVNFAYTDGAIPISVPQIFFEYLANYASYPFLIAEGLRHKNEVKLKINELEASIAFHISNRAKPRRAGLRVAQEDNR